MMNIFALCFISSIVHAFLLFQIFRWRLSATPASLYIFYNGLSVLTVPLVLGAINTQGTIPFTALPYAYVVNGLQPAILYFTSFSLVAFIVAFSTRRKRLPLHVIDKTNLLKNYAVYVDGRGKALILYFSIFSTTIIILHFLDADKSKLFEYSYYLEIVHPEFAGMSSFLTSTIHKYLYYLGVVSIFFSAIAYRDKSTFVSLMLAIAWLYCLTFAIAANSRWAVVLCIAATAAFAYRKNKIQWLPLVLGTLSACAAFIVVLTGRASGQYGLSHLGGNILSIDGQNLLIILTGIWANLFDGIFNIAAVFEFRPSAPAVYQWLSMSPLPSAIDGFAQIRRSNEIRISTFVPYGAYSEAIAFGVVSMAIFYSTLVILLTLAQRTAIGTTKNIYRLLISAPVLMVLCFSYQYQMRTNFRIALLFIVIFVFVQMYTNLRLPKSSWPRI